MDTAIYTRVSSRSQDQASQLPDLEKYAKSVEDGKVRWYTDKASGTTMDRVGWRKLEADLRAGKIGRIVVWRVDRLGRTATGLTSLFAELNDRKVNLVSLRDSLDLSTPPGRLLAHVLASVAQYETEIRSERSRAGQEVARAKGVHMGRPPGKHTPLKVTAELRDHIRELHRAGKGATEIGRLTSLTRQTVAKVINQSEA